MKVFKYPLDVKDQQVITVKGFVKFLCVQTQEEKPCLWCVVAENWGYDDVEIMVVTVGTGHELGVNSDDYIGTYQLRGGDLVFHVFAYVHKTFLPTSKEVVI